MLSSRFARTFAACAATLALVSSSPGFAARGPQRAAKPPIVHAKPPLVHATGFNGATLDPNGGGVDVTSALPPGPDGGLNVARQSPLPDGHGALIDPNG